MLTAMALLLGLGLLALVLQDAFEVMLLPRRVDRRVRLTRFYFQASWKAWSCVALRLPEGGRRDRFLSVFGALSMVVLFALWAAALIVGFGLVQWTLRGYPSPDSPLGAQIYMSGVTFFTLGYGDVVPHTGLARFVAVVEAGIGIGFLAVVIGYLPVLYQMFSRREAHVIQLDARAGSPPTACTLLRRHAEYGGLQQLNGVLRDWEIWGAELLESHLSYPMLVYYRSQHDNQSWLAAITAVMDACAMILVAIEDIPPLQARMTFTMARQVLVELARSLGIRPRRHELRDRLPSTDFLRMEAILVGAGVTWNPEPTLAATLASLRATYEPLVAGLADALLLSLPGWVAEDDAADHWQRGHRGLIARDLIERLSSERDPVPPPGRLGRRVRDHLSGIARRRS